MLPHLTSNDRLVTALTKANVTSNFNTSSTYLSPPIYSTLNATYVISTENETNDYLLVLRQKRTNPDEPIHPFVIDLSQNRSSTEINQKWFKSGLSIIKSCSLVHEGLMYVYGGRVEERQILKLDWCNTMYLKQWGNTKLIRVGQLKFDFTGGTCATNGAVFVLCFGSIGSRTCYRTFTPVPTSDWWTWFEPVVNSYHNHRLSLITSSQGKH